ncbi:S8 family peptidase [Tetragenococcus halophilus]|uniref:S8 family peptidase n=1 Tax=Tetragenococcus halophilus TaxID=51669 RepID=UPI002A968495|nr:hypothetical protein TEHSL10_10510 [Tetragenococcus halophilus]
MDIYKHNPLITNGVILAKEGKQPSRRGNRDDQNKYKRNLEEAQYLLNTKISKMKNTIKETSSNFKLSSELFFKIDYPAAFLAKSYQVNSVYKIAGLDIVGSSSWIDDDGKQGKSDYLRGSYDQIEMFESIIVNPKAKIHKSEIRRMDNIELLKPYQPNKFFTSTEHLNNYELLFHSVNENSKEELVEKVQELLGTGSSRTNIQWLDNNILCVNVNLNKLQQENILLFNPLRSIYPYKGRDYSAINYGFEKLSNDKKVNMMEEEVTTTLPFVGIIDGGVRVREAPFYTVEQLYEVETASSEQFVEHGSSVASVILYGDLGTISQQDVSPSFRAESVRALPSNWDSEFNLVSLEKIIREVVPKYPNIKIWNLSIGPKGPVQDEIVSSLTRLLDTLAYENDVIFVIAAGNTGEEQGIGSRVQIPGDSVNNITVSSYYNFDSLKWPATYNSIGPGREGAKLKPDIIEHGGLLPNDPILAFSSLNYAQNKVAGTSFAAPLITRKLAQILSLYPDFTTLQARALLEHSLAIGIEKDRDISVMSKGELEESESLIFTNSKNEVKIMYSGTISSKGLVKLPIPLPENYVSKKVKFTWTLAIKSPVNPDFPNNYTLHCIEDDFYPDSHHYTFTDDNGQEIILDLTDEEQIKQANKLLLKGYKQKDYPIKKENPKYLNESERRKKFLKWDTIKTQQVTKKTTSLFEPFIRLHGLSRKDTRDRIDYALVVTVNMSKDMDIHNSILQRYTQLQEIQLDTSIQTKV